MTASNQGGNKGGASDRGINNTQSRSVGTQASDQGNQGSDLDRSSQSGDISNRVFRSMDSNKQSDINPEGGRAAQAPGSSQDLTSDESREAGAMSQKGSGSQQSETRGNQQSESRGGRSAESGSAGNQAGSGKQGASSGAGRKSSGSDSGSR
jgi:hypothetical protein